MPHGIAAHKQPVILQVLPELRAGGVERGTLEMAQAIQQAGWQAIVASAGGSMVHALDKMGAKHIELPLHSKNPFTLRANALELARVIKEHQVDIVHARSRAPAWSAYWAARKTGARFMTTFHGTYNISGKWKQRYNAVMTKGERVIAISEFIREHILAHYEVEPERLRLIHRGVDVEKFSQDQVTGMRVDELAKSWNMPEDPETPVILMPGRITRWKGQDVLLEALARIKEERFFCVLLGDDAGHPAFRRELENKIIALGLAGKARIAPNTRHMAEAYMLATVVVAPSIEPEAFGRIPVEAQAMGRPIIATGHGGFRETIIDGETGWLVPPADAAALATRLSQALSMSAKEREEWGVRARQHACDYFSSDLMKHKTINVYSELLWPQEHAMQARSEPA
jgi:glycosyltransferase involved in cell wall biosynthesis